MNPGVCFTVEARHLAALKARVEELELSLDALNHLASRCFKDVLVLTRQLRVLGQEMPDGGSEGFKTSFQPFRINASDDDEFPF